MSELKRTELRHRMLAKVAAGKVEFYQGIEDSLIVDGDFLAGAARRTQLDVLPYVTGRVRGRMGTITPAGLTEDGRVLLAAWNKRYGEVQL